jgi:hypothetical protein
MRRLIVALVLMSGISIAQQPGSGEYGDQFPDAPEPIRALPFGGYAHDKAGDPPKYVIWNKKFTFAHVVELSSILYDVEMTHEGLAHHKCAEGGGGITETHVSRKELYTNDLLPFAVLTGLDVLFKYTMREKHVAWVPYVYPVYGSILHFKGGTQWATQCW